MHNSPFLSVIGVSHHSCPLEVREKFAFSCSVTTGEDEDAHRDAIWLSTCNRTEMYSALSESAAAETTFAKTLDIPVELAVRYTYRLEDDQACEHLFRVARGLESLVLGEDEILDQVRRALTDAQDRGSTHPVLTRVFQDALNAGKRVRSETEINRFPASVSTAAASIVRELCGNQDLKTVSVLVIGAGEMGNAVLRCLKGMRAQHLAIANRTRWRAEEIARETGAEVMEWPVRPEALARYHAVIACTGAPEYILPKRTIETMAQHLQPDAYTLLVDIAVPRDIDPDASSVPGVRLYNIDNVQDIVDDSVSRRIKYVEPAEQIIREQVDGFSKWMAARNVSDSIRLMRERADLIRLDELDWVMPKLSPSYHGREGCGRSVLREAGQQTATRPHLAPA